MVQGYFQWTWFFLCVTDCWPLTNSRPRGSRWNQTVNGEWNKKKTRKWSSLLLQEKNKTKQSPSKTKKNLCISSTCEVSPCLHLHNIFFPPLQWWVPEWESLKIIKTIKRHADITAILKSLHNKNIICWHVWWYKMTFNIVNILMGVISPV